MGFSFRKSVKFGPVRVNFSSRGVGYSAGVRGFRVGKDAAGRSYMTAGRGGLLYRTYGSSDGSRTAGSMAPPVREHVQDDGYKQTAAKAKDLLEFAPEAHTWLWAIMVVGGFYLAGVRAQDELGALMFGGGTGLLGLFFLVQENSKRARIKDETTWVAERLKNRELPKLLEWLKKAEARKRTGYDAAILASAYQAFIPPVIEDGVLSPAESECLALLNKLVPEDVRSHVNSIQYARLVYDFAADERLSQAEEAVLKAFKAAFPVPARDLEAIERDLEFFREVEALRNALPVPQPAGRGIDDEAYLVLEGTRLLKNKVLARRSVQSQKVNYTGNIAEAEGTMIVGKKALYLVSDGVQKWPLKNLVDFNYEAGASALSLTLSTRKTPVLISSPANAKLAAVLSALQE